MEIQLKELKEGKTQFKFKKQKGEVLEIEKKERFEIINFEVSGEITKSRLEYFLTLNVISKILFECARCLEKFEKNFEEKGEYHIKIGRDKSLDKREMEIQEDDINTIYLEEPILNLVPLVREIILLSIPMKPLCEEDCKGLCPICGKNKNKEDCKCKVELSTPLSKLKDVFKK